MEFDRFKLVTLRAGKSICPTETIGKNFGSKTENAELAKL